MREAVVGSMGGCHEESELCRRCGASAEARRVTFVV